MFYLSNQFICIYFIFFNRILKYNANALDCILPEGCRSGKIVDAPGYYTFIDSSLITILCDINDDAFEFKFKEPTHVLTAKKCLFENDDNLATINFRWISNDLTVLDRKFNFTNVIRYFDYFGEWAFYVYFWNLKGFDVNFLDKKFDKLVFIDINIWNCQLDFYHSNKRKLQSCQDFADSNITEIQSIFQATLSSLSLNYIEYKQKMCPLVFRNTRMDNFEINNLIDTFYKRNVFSFSADEIDSRLNSQIKTFQLSGGFNINLDLNIIHPIVFNYTKNIIIKSLLNRIDGDIFEQLKNLKRLDIDEICFTRINHKQGIKWIRQWNHNLTVNLSNIEESCSSYKQIITTTSKLSRIFPEEDFCIYVDFPFNQLVIVSINFYGYNTDKYEESTCTYLWLVQYYRYYLDICEYEYIEYFKNFEIVFNSTAYKSISKCKFEQKISYCNKSNYQIKDIWDRTDFLILNKKLRIAFKLLIYPTAILGIITNVIVVAVIQLKENSDLFKEFKHFSYLCLNSVFCILILIIEILSWMNECFYPYQVFCPEIRKLVAIQFFKIIFKECFVTVFKFMCNFTYVAFALNRISLIGKDHGKIVTFFSELGIKKYIGITLLISASLSWIKYFKYYVNYTVNLEIDEFPFLNEDNLEDLSNDFFSAYYIINSISFFVNYFLFVVICAIIDICMVVQLRRVLEEKAKKSESLNQKQNEAKKAENEEAVNKSIKMVVLNTSIGIFLKLPVSFIPILNVCAYFYYLNPEIENNHHGFGYIYQLLRESESYIVIEDVSYFLFTLSLSIQVFIYNRFDKKFQTGYERLMNKISCRKNTLNQSK